MKMTKKKVLFVGLVGTLMFVSLVLISRYGYEYCVSQGHCWKFWRSLDVIGPFLSFFTLIFLLSLITYKMREEVFRSWLCFAYWWIPLSILSIFVAGGGGGGGFGIGDIFDQEFVAMIFASLFFLISLAIISVKSWKLRGK